jgi:chromosome segregation ATPase
MFTGKKGSTVRSFAEKSIQVVLWLCFEHQWKQWELLIIAGTALLLLLLILRLLRKGRTVEAQAYELSERSPIIGVRLADHRHSRREIRDLQKSRSAHDTQPGIRQENRKTTRQLEKLNRQIEQFQRDIAERQQTDVVLRKRIMELTASNEQLRAEIVKHRQTEAHLKQRLAELEAANEPLRQEKLQKKPENVPIQSDERKPGSRRHSGPLNVEELSHLAELGKRLAPRRPS